MSKAYTAARVEMIEPQEPPQARQEEDIPLLFLHDIERHYRQGDETLHVLSGIEPRALERAVGCPRGAFWCRQVDTAPYCRSARTSRPWRRLISKDARRAILADHERTRIRRNEIGFRLSSPTICCRNSPHSKTCCCRR